MTYKEVVKKAQNELARRGIYGKDKGQVELYACNLWRKSDQINLWSYWQGYQIKDIDKGIDIMLVGQDWGNPDWDKAVAERIAKMQAGEQIAYCDGKLSPTDRNLIELFEILDCDVRSANPGKRIIFTNYCLGYRKGSQSRGMTRALMDMDKELFDDLVMAVHPKVIICLGKITYEAVTGQRTKGFTKYLKEGRPFVTEYPNSAGIKVYGVAHCGSLGIRNVKGMDNAKKAWEVISRDF